MSADPIPFVAAAWALSALVLGALTAHAMLSGRRR